MIVDGAVGMVEMALERLSEGEIVELDEERRLPWFRTFLSFSVAIMMHNQLLIREVSIKNG